MKPSVPIIIFFGIVLSVPSTGQDKRILVSGIDYVPGQIVILLKESAESQTSLAVDLSDHSIEMGLPTLDALHSRKGVMAIGESPARHVSTLANRRYVLEIPQGEEHNLVRVYAENEHVETVSLNYIYHTALTPNDTN